VTQFLTFCVIIIFIVVASFQLSSFINDVQVTTKLEVTNLEKALIPEEFYPKVAFYDHTMRDHVHRFFEFYITDVDDKNNVRIPINLLAFDDYESPYGDPQL